METSGKLRKYDDPLTLSNTTTQANRCLNQLLSVTARTHVTQLRFYLSCACVWFHSRTLSTYGLCQRNHYFLAGGCLSDPTDDPLDSIHPDLELHVGSEAMESVVVCWPRHY